MFLSFIYCHTDRPSLLSPEALPPTYFVCACADALERNSNPILACEMSTSGCRPCLKNVACLSSLIPLSKRRTAQQKVNFLELMLGQIANYCLVISRNTLVKNPYSPFGTWYAHILASKSQELTFWISLTCICMAADERPEDLFQRLMAFVEEALLCATMLK